jgi:hypothetical protein
MSIQALDDRPVVYLPGGATEVRETAEELGVLTAATRRVFLRGNNLFTMSTNPCSGDVELVAFKPEHAVTFFEEIAELKKWFVSKGGDAEARKCTCPETTAKHILAASHFTDHMPQITLLSGCPVLVEREDGRLDTVVGYDKQTGIFASGLVEEVPFPEAVSMLQDVICDFDFPEGGDQSRALASMITPCLVMGGLINRARAPMDGTEADASQGGKGYRNKITAAIYACTPKTVTNQKGLGSIEEGFNTALIRGAPFISLDNVRGKIQSEALESFLTEDLYEARALRQSVEIDPTRITVMFTSNAAEANEDIKNRTSLVCIKKRPEGYPFKQFPEGAILDHVRANQPRFLGAVFSVVREWVRQGKQRTQESRHAFRGWAQALDWIVQNLLDSDPLLAGHQEAQQRMTSPHLTWVRELALVVESGQMLGMEFRPYQLIDLLAETELEVPGVGDGDIEDDDVRSSALKATGKRLASIFKGKDELRIDTFIITKDEQYDPDYRKPVKTYSFAHAGKPDLLPLCSRRAPDGAPDKPLCAPDAPESSELVQQQNNNRINIYPNPDPSGASGATVQTREFHQAQIRRNQAQIGSEQEQMDLAGDVPQNKGPIEEEDWPC